MRTSVGVRHCDLRAKGVDDTPRAVRPARDAGPASVPDEELVRAAPAFGREQRGKLRLDLVGIFRARKTETTRYATYMCVHRQRRCAEGVVDDHACGLPSDTGQLVELLSSARQLASVFAHDLAHGGAEILRLGTKEADAPDHLLQLRRAG